MELTDEQQNRIEPIITTLSPRKDPRGRKLHDARQVINGIWWILRTGVLCKDLPERATIDWCFIRYAPGRLIGDKAYDSDQLDKQLFNQRDIELIAPHRAGQKSNHTGWRKTAQIQERWQGEWLFAWLQNFRRLNVRYEYHYSYFLALSLPAL